MLGLGRKVCLKVKGSKWLVTIIMKANFFMERRTAKGSSSIKMVAIMKENLKTMQFRVKANTLIKIIFGKEFGKMDTWREKVDKLLLKIT